MSRSNITRKTKETVKIFKILDTYQFSTEDTLYLLDLVNKLNDELVEAQDKILEARFVLGESRYK